MICVHRKGYRVSPFCNHAKKKPDTDTICTVYFSYPVMQLNILYSVCSMLKIQETCRIWLNNISRKRHS